MLTEQEILELRAVLQAQHRLLAQITAATQKVESSLAQGLDDAREISELQALVAELESSSEYLKPEDFQDLQLEQVVEVYKERGGRTREHLHRLGADDWPSFVRSCQICLLQQGADPLMPYEALLSEEELRRLKETNSGWQHHWDGWDYVFVGTSGLLAALTDLFLVRIPQTIGSTSRYAGQVGSPLTAWMKKWGAGDGDRSDLFRDWVRLLEERCAVPYDAQRAAGFGDDGRIPGMAPRSHRLQSLGHDPVLGFVFGVRDLMRGTVTGFSYEAPGRRHSYFSVPVASSHQPVGLVEALLRHIGHLVSDVPTPMGLPPPFWTALQALNVGSFGDRGRTVAEVARWMYLNGYDLRHFLAQGLSPAVIEIVLRGYLMLRHLHEQGEVPFALESHPKYRCMLVTAHAVAAAGNVGKIALYQGNPLALNLAQWLALFSYLVPLLKYWIFERHHLEMERLEGETNRVWDELARTTGQLLEKVMADLPMVELGRDEGSETETRPPGGAPSLRRGSAGAPGMPES
jgi:hypothetical protein